MGKRDNTCSRQPYLEQVKIDRSFISQLCILYYFSGMPSGTIQDTLTSSTWNGSLSGQSNMPRAAQARKIHTYSVMN